MQIAYLGDKNSHTYAAATAFATQYTSAALCGFSSVRDCLASVGDTCDMAVVPVENSIEGTVAETVDALGHAGLFIVAERVLPVRQALVVIKGGSTDKIERVYSHPQALAQCRENIRKVLPNATKMALAYTSAALDLVDEKCAAIARVCKEGQEILIEDMGDMPNNRTRFLLVGKKPQNEGNKASVMFSLPNESGALLGALSALAACNANMTKIESRPDKKHLGSYAFYVDFVFEKGRLNETLASLAEVTSVTFLGRYEEWKDEARD